MTPGRPSNSLHFKVGELSGKIDQVLSTLLEDRRKWEGLDVRVGSLESFRSQAIGASSIMVLVIGSWEVVRYVWSK
jgi:hypothetical protein